MFMELVPTVLYLMVGKSFPIHVRKDHIINSLNFAVKYIHCNFVLTDQQTVSSNFGISTNQIP